MKRILLPLFIICSISGVVNAGIRDVKELPSGGSVSSTRTINTTAPLTGGGDLSSDRTLAITTPLSLIYGGSGTNTAAGARVNFGIDARTTFSNQAYQVLATDKVVAQIGTLSASRVVTLPLANKVNAGYELIIKDSSGSVTGTNTIVITASGADMIDGATTEIIACAYDMRKLFSDGVSKWSYDKGVLRNPNPTVNSDYAADRVTNGTFNTDLTGWSGANWTWDASGAAIHASGATTAFTQAGTVGVVGRLEKITFVIGGTPASSITVGIGGQTSLTFTTTGTKTVYITPTTTGALIFTPATGFTGTIDNVTCRVQTVGQLTVDGGITVNNGQLLLPQGSNIYPSISHYANPTGFRFDATSVYLVNNGSNAFQFSAGTMYFSVSPWTINFNADTILLRNAANFLEMRNTTNIQYERFDASYTDASNYKGMKIGGDGTFRIDQAGTGISTVPFTFTHSHTLSASPTDDYAATLKLVPTYSGAYTVTRHNYMDMNNVTNATGTITDACVIRFDAAAGTHKAIDAGTTKVTPVTVDAWEKININGTIYFIPCYTSKTS